MCPQDGCLQGEGRSPNTAKRGGEPSGRPKHRSKAECRGKKPGDGPMGKPAGTAGKTSPKAKRAPRGQGDRPGGSRGTRRGKRCTWGKTGKRPGRGNNRPEGSGAPGKDPQKRGSPSRKGVGETRPPREKPEGRTQKGTKPQTGRAKRLNGKTPARGQRESRSHWGTKPKVAEANQESVGQAQGVEDTTGPGRRRNPEGESQRATRADAGTPGDPKYAAAEGEPQTGQRTPREGERRANARVYAWTDARAASTRLHKASLEGGRTSQETRTSAAAAYHPRNREGRGHGREGERGSGRQGRGANSCIKQA